MPGNDGGCRVTSRSNLHAKLADDEAFGLLSTGGRLKAPSAFKHVNQPTNNNKFD